MWKTVTFSIVSAAILTCVSASAADLPSDLLEKAIYTEETVGDLDKAIEIYEKIISQAKANRKFVAQAQNRVITLAPGTTLIATLQQALDFLRLKILG